MSGIFGNYGTWVVNLEGEWWSLEGDAIASVDGLESLTGPVQVLTDFDNLRVDVETLNGDKSYATPLIEKHLRKIGVLDEPGRVLIHACKQQGGTTRALYSAMPVETYADYVTRAANQSDHCLLFSFASAMYRHAISGGGEMAVVLQHGRQFDVLMTSGRDLVGMIHVTAFSTDDADLEQAVSELAQALRKKVDETGHEPGQIRWFSFGAKAGVTLTLSRAMEHMTEIPVEVAVEERMGKSADGRQTSMREFIAPLRVGDAVNGVASRLLVRMEQIVPAMAAIVLACSLALFGAAWHWTNQTNKIHRLTQATAQQTAGVDLRQMAAIASQAGGVLSQSGAVHKQFEFLSEIQEALAAPDMRHIIKDVQAATPISMQIIGINFSKANQGVHITIDGSTQAPLRQAVGDMQRLTAELRHRGYRVSGDESGAIDENNNFRLMMVWRSDHGKI